ncbi:hypothetical protein ACLQ8T_05715 [Glutamicibacter sp. FR1]|uniref:hypothetical protein n=1 Tax=Glutamicibacter sp. FR1 TaxID=3393744 RepID=UPI0039B05F81
MADQLSKIERLQIQVAGLETTLARRNEVIARLEERIKNGEGVNGKQEYQRGYKAGWKDCAGGLMEFTRKANQALEQVNKVAFRTWLEGDKL